MWARSSASAQQLFPAPGPCRLHCSICSHCATPEFTLQEVLCTCHPDSPMLCMRPPVVIPKRNKWVCMEWHLVCVHAHRFIVPLLATLCAGMGHS
eukprot:scaffold85868_cov24-Tisochrysis_lutea.AAC.1